MYAPISSISADHPSSSSTKNLSILFIPHSSSYVLSTISSSYINLLFVTKDGELLKSTVISCRYKKTCEPLYIYQAKLLSTIRHILVAVCCQGCIQMYEAESGELLYEEALEPNPINSEHYVKGVCCFELDTICFGNSKGEVFIYKYSGAKLFRSEIVQVSCQPVWEVASDNEEQLVAVGDDYGDVVLVVKLMSQDLKKKMLAKGDCAGICNVVYKGEGYPCTSILFHKKKLICSYGNGLIKLLGVNEGKIEMLCEVTAHARIITDMSLAPDHDMFLSAGEDCIVRLWTIKDTKISHKDNVRVENRLIGGCQFVDNSVDHFVLSAYDYKEIFRFQIRK